MQQFNCKLRFSVPYYPYDRQNFRLCQWVPSRISLGESRIAQNNSLLPPNYYIIVAANVNENCVSL